MEDERMKVRVKVESKNLLAVDFLPEPLRFYSECVSCVLEKNEDRIE